MVWRPASSLLALLAALVIGGSAAAELPPGHLLLVRGGTIDDGTLPGIVVLADGPQSLQGLSILLDAVLHTADEVMLYDSNDRSVVVMAVEDFNPPGLEASYVDPGTGATSFAFLTPASEPDGSAGVMLADGPTGALGTLLEPSGAVLLFPVPEPAQWLLLTAGLLLLRTLPRRRC